MTGDHDGVLDEVEWAEAVSGEGGGGLGYSVTMALPRCVPVTELAAPASRPGVTRTLLPPAPLVPALSLPPLPFLPPLGSPVRGALSGLICPAGTSQAMNIQRRPPIGLPGFVSRA